MEKICFLLLFARKKYIFHTSLLPPPLPPLCTTSFHTIFILKYSLHLHKERYKWYFNARDHWWDYDGNGRPNEIHGLDNKTGFYCVCKPLFCVLWIRHTLFKCAVFEYYLLLIKFKFWSASKKTLVSIFKFHNKNQYWSDCDDHTGICAAFFISICVTN